MRKRQDIHVIVRGTKMFPSNFKSRLWYTPRPIFGDFDRLAEIKV
jgi:hypothetical protein